MNTIPTAPDEMPGAFADPGQERHDDETRALLRISRAELPPPKLAALMEQSDGSATAMLSAGHGFWRSAGLTAAQSARLSKCAREDVSRDLETLARLGARVVTCADAEYPGRLRQLPDAPFLLYARGRIDPADQFSLAIVGSRRATSYGLSLAERFARELAGHGLSVVSGGARGIDTYAHRGAHASGGRTLAVIGCGLDVAYPSENRKLFDAIAESGRGAILTEYPLGATPEPWRFPARNRLISGISIGTLVIESPLDSGALITATDAASQGRDVFAIPGPIETGLNTGCHKLIQEGAKLTTCVEDILEEIGVLSLSMPGAKPTRSALLAPPALDLTPDQRLVLDRLSLQAANIDQISDATALAAASVVAILTMLELKGVARRVPGNAFVRVL